MSSRHFVVPWVANLFCPCSCYWLCKCSCPPVGPGPHLWQANRRAGSYVRLPDCSPPGRWVLSGWLSGSFVVASGSGDWCSPFGCVSHTLLGGYRTPLKECVARMHSGIMSGVGFMWGQFPDTGVRKLAYLVCPGPLVLLTRCRAASSGHCQGLGSGRDPFCSPLCLLWSRPLYPCPFSSHRVG